jgi:hypothetical protein
MGETSKFDSLEYKCARLQSWPGCDWYCKDHGSRGAKEHVEGCPSCINRAAANSEAEAYEAQQ